MIIFLKNEDKNNIEAEYSIQGKDSILIKSDVNLLNGLYKIELKTLIEIHLLTHKSTSNHSMRRKYRSAVYYFTNHQKEEIFKIIEELQSNFNEKIITQTLEFKRFKSSTEEFQNYYKSNPKKPFCKNYIQPKLKFLLENFSNKIDNSKVKQ